MKKTGLTSFRLSQGETMLLKLAKGYAPSIGSTFNIVTGSAITGQFASPNLKINHSEHFSIAYGPTAVTLTVVAGP